MTTRFTERDVYSISSNRAFVTYNIEAMYDTVELCTYYTTELPIDTIETTIEDSCVENVINRVLDLYDEDTDYC